MGAPSPTSRFQLLERPLRLPGKCVVCGAVDRPVVDLVLDLLHYGTVYFCVTCLAEAATFIGMVPEETVVSLRSAAEHSVTDYLVESNLRTITNEQYNAVFGALDLLSTNFPDDSGDGLVHADEHGGEEESADVPVIPDTTESADKKPRSNGRSTSKPGPASVPADNGNGLGIFDLG